MDFYDVEIEYNNSRQCELVTNIKTLLIVMFHVVVKMNVIVAVCDGLLFRLLTFQPLKKF